MVPTDVTFITSSSFVVTNKYLLHGGPYRELLPRINTRLLRPQCPTPAQLSLSHTFNMRLNPVSKDQTPSPKSTLQKLMVVTAVTGIALVAQNPLSGSGFQLQPPSANASVLHLSGQKPDNVKLNYERYLSLCPEVENCITTSGNIYSKTYVPPWIYNFQNQKGSPKSMDKAVEELTEVLKNYPGATVITSRPVSNEIGNGYYIYAEFESPFWGFVDDVEFLFQPDGKTVDYRSASRFGEKDFQANRKRIKEIRVQLQQQGWKSEGFRFLVPDWYQMNAYFIDTLQRIENRIDR